MDPLFKQLRDLPRRWGALSAKARAALLAAAAGAIVLAVLVARLAQGGDYQYVFANLSPEDSSEAAAALKDAGIPHRLEAGGAALAVPASQVHQARLLLATAGLPRGGGVGFELFDRGDLGVSEFTQRVNLRRAIEGELARTIGRLAEVRSARVHLTIAERGLFREGDKPASAAVVVNLKPGRVLGDRELAGIRHLVASAVPSLAADAVTIVDGRGAVLSSKPGASEASADYEQRLERDLEARVVSLLEPVVGPGAVVARVDALLDTSEVGVEAESFDPDSAALRSERRVVESQSQSGTRPRAGGVAGAAANQPGSALAPASAQNRSESTSEEATRTFELSRTVTRTTNKTPRLLRLSVAILLDGEGGKPRPDAEVARLGELAKRAVGFDPERGDQFEISSAVFTRSAEEAPLEPPAALPSWLAPAGAGAGLLLLLALAARLLRGRRSTASRAEIAFLRPGASVAQLEAARAAPEGSPLSLPASGEAGQAMKLREQARGLAAADPTRAAQLLRAWIAADRETEESHARG